jgi:hypothetical protein
VRPDQALVTQEDVELAERLHEGAEVRIEELFTELRQLLRRARISPKTIAQRDMFRRLEAARIASSPTLDDLIDGVAEAAARGECRPSTREEDLEYMRMQRDIIAAGMAPDHRAAAMERMDGLIDGEERARDAIQVLDEEECE